tara:strand:+ start:1214 stop:1861 length:648 start_codon:yes stop_codon:yes gene_type:complete
VLKLKLTANKFNSDPYWATPIFDDGPANPSEFLELFDQNGYDLCQLEQLYAMANQVDTNYHRTNHVAFKQEWFEDEDNSVSGPHINHTAMFERKGYQGQALEQLQTWADTGHPLCYKLIQMKPKWGLDFSIDYVDDQANVFELLHWEWDGFDYEEVQEKKDLMDQFLISQDWEHSAKVMLSKKDEWHHLPFFEQSKWKTDFFGIEKERFKMVLWK